MTRNPKGWTGVDDPLWYKDAIVYQLHVKVFGDSSQDGIGDFRGLISAWTTSRSWEWIPCGSCRSIPRRCGTTVTILPTI